MMRISTLFAFAAFPLLAACSGTTSPQDSAFDPGGKLMQEAIQDHISQFPYQSGQELWSNALWVAAKGEPAIPLLLKALEDKAPRMRSSAAFALGLMKDRRVIKYLPKHLEDPSFSVRLETARSLLYLGEFKGVPVLIEGLNNSEQPVRMYCAESLREMTGKDFDYDHRQKTPEQRKEAISKWTAWWKDQGSGGWLQTAADKASQPAAPAGK